MKTFKDAVVWQKSYELTLLVYRTTQDFPKSEEFGLKSQLRRASVSIVSNFAEGFKRLSKKEKAYFFRIAEGSLEEIKCQLMLAKDLLYIDGESYGKLEIMEDEVGRLLSAWIRANSP